MSEFRMVFDGIKLYYNEEIVNDRIQIKISYKTALLFIDGINICSFYPTKSNAKWVAEDIMEYCMENGVVVSKEEAEAITRYCVKVIEE